MVILFWGMLSEQIGQQFVERIGIDANNVREVVGEGVLDSQREYVHEFIRLYGESAAKPMVAEFVKQVVLIAEQAALNIDDKGGAS
jgi:hypothetical protein